MLDAVENSTTLVTTSCKDKDIAIPILGYHRIHLRQEHRLSLALYPRYGVVSQVWEAFAQCGQ